MTTPTKVISSTKATEKTKDHQNVLHFMCSCLKTLQSEIVPKKMHLFFITEYGNILPRHKMCLSVEANMISASRLHYLGIAMLLFSDQDPSLQYCHAETSKILAFFFGCFYLCFFFSIQ